MLLEFAVTNYGPFRERAVMSFVSTARKDEPVHRFDARHATHGVLPVLGLWGANAVGKSMLIEALLQFIYLIERSASQLPNTPVPWTPWCLDTRPGAPRTELVADLLVGDDELVQIGVHIDHRGFCKEWAYRWSGSRRQVLYERDHDKPDPWYFGPSLGGDKVRIARSTRVNALFLSTAAQQNHAVLSEVYTAVISLVRRDSGIDLNGFPLFPGDAPILAPANQAVVLALLQQADLGLTGVRAVEAGRPPPEALATLPVEAREAFAAMPDMHYLQFKRCLDGVDVELPVRSESTGTHSLVARVNDLLPVLQQGRLIVIDEIDTSLHPDLCRALVGLFTDPRSNPNGAQLLFTTHDRGLLQSLRTDEVLMIDKDADGASRAVAVSDYRDVRTRDDLALLHQQGRIGGVPLLGDLVGLIADRLAPAPNRRAPANR